MAKLVTVSLFKGKVNDQLEKTILEYFICNDQHRGTKSVFCHIYNSIVVVRKDS